MSTPPSFQEYFDTLTNDVADSLEKLGRQMMNPENQPSDKEMDDLFKDLVNIKDVRVMAQLRMLGQLRNLRNAKDSADELAKKLAKRCPEK